VGMALADFHSTFYTVPPRVTHGKSLHQGFPPLGLRSVDLTPTIRDFGTLLGDPASPRSQTPKLTGAGDHDRVPIGVPKG
jgi:hypothetical protein